MCTNSRSSGRTIKAFGTVLVCSVEGKHVTTASQSPGNVLYKNNMAANDSSIFITVEFIGNSDSVWASGSSVAIVTKPSTESNKRQPASYIYIYIYIHTHTHIYIYIYI